MIESIHYFSHKKHGKLISRRTVRAFFHFRTQRLWFTSEFLSVCNVKKNCKKDVLLWLNSNTAPPWSEMKREQWCINQDQSRELEKLHFTCVSASFVLAFPYRELGTHPGLFLGAELFVWKMRPSLEVFQNWVLIQFKDTPHIVFNVDGLIKSTILNKGTVSCNWN